MDSGMENNFIDIMNHRVVVFDGAMGTSIQRLALSSDDFLGNDGCNEILVLSKPDVIKNIHASFFEVDCDVVETNTFGATSIVLSEYSIQDQVYKINRAAAQLAQSIAKEYTSKISPKWVAGSIGPGTKLPSLGHISFQELKSAYDEQGRGLFDGGVDMFIVETCQDLLQMKAALISINDLFRIKRVRIPIIAQVTIESSGTMLLGTEILAVLTTLLPFNPDVIGLNCGTGPKEMSEHIRVLSSHSPKFISVIPNAGIPKSIEGEMVFDLTPDELTSHLRHYCKDLGVNIVGGCCGTTPEHLKAVVKAVSHLTPATRDPEFTPSVASLYFSQPVRTEPKPLIVGERTNASGSKAFREFLLKDDFEGMISIAQSQIEEQAHILDISTAYAGRNEIEDMTEFIFRLNTQSPISMMIDSTSFEVIKAALQRISGRAVINSVNLEDGEKRATRIIELSKRYGAMLVCLTIDEEGMAKTSGRKLEVAKRIYNLAVHDMGLKPSDLLFDTLTFTLGSGDEEFRRSAVETLDALKRVKTVLPGVHTLLGVSNCSFGLKTGLRQFLNSIFLRHAIEHGLNAAIVHAGKILPLYQIPEKIRRLCDDLIFDRREEGYDPLVELISTFEKKKAPEEIVRIKKSLPVEERIKKRIIDGQSSGLEDDLKEAMKTYVPIEIVNRILLAGMKKVGDLFSSGDMQLPFVLKSSEIMKEAVVYLEPFMERLKERAQGKIIIATVMGDVHDIGKNLVDIILTNNGYEVINLGIRQHIDAILDAWQKSNSNAIGMSGLLVKSTLVMRENLEVMNERKVLPPVILGGAALTRQFVEEELSPVYHGDVYYAKDAFDGLRFMDKICGMKATDFEIG